VLRLFLITVGVVACASSQRPQEIPKTDRSSDPRVEIESLDQQIAGELMKLDIQPFTAACVEKQTCSADPAPVATCSNPAAACTDTCTLGESICTNATRICELAKQLGGLDTYANEKCEHGTESCKAARERCCNCKP
jgi:hypothetical protein